MTSRRPQSFIGARFGRLCILGDNGKTQAARRVEVLCDCGARRWVRPGCLTGGKTRSCGCLRREITSKRQTTHAESGTRLHKCWAGMLERCRNPNRPEFKNYGGRGIRVCKRWWQFEPFRDWAVANGYQDNLTLDRKNTNGHYCPSNCRWATRSQQTQSQRKRATSQTPYIGVSWHYRQGWSARVGGKGQSLGHFEDPFSAAWVRDAYVKKHYVKKHYDKYATLNNLKDRRKRQVLVKPERRGTFDWQKVLAK